MELLVHQIRGHNLVDLADFLYEPDKIRQKYLDEGYGENFVENQARIFGDFVSGKIKIELVAGCLDDVCLGDCERKETMGQKEGEIPCEDPRGIKVDTQTAGSFLLEIGETYSFIEIEKNLRNFYLDQHSM